MKENIFKIELEYIKNGRIKKSAISLINLLPDYFFEVPASSTGKYHPSYALGDKGLVRHTKAAVKIAYDLLNNLTTGSAFTSDEKDLIILSLLVHDGFKSGLVKEKYTKVDHPLIVSNFIKENSNKLTLEDNEIEFLTSNIESHMGQWNTDFNGNEVLPLPKLKGQRFVHMCDYLASRKYLEVTFDKEDNIIL